MKCIYLAVLFALCGLNTYAQVSYNKNGQALPPETQRMTATDFENHNALELTWLTNAGFLVNDNGLCLMIDPMLQGYDLPLLRVAPIAPKDVPAIDGILITHTDNDHMSLATLKDFPHADVMVHGTGLVADTLRKEGFKAAAHRNFEPFKIGDFEVMLVPAFHAYQYDYPGAGKPFGKEDCCGFLVKTPSGKVIWHTGDTRLLPEHLDLPWTPDFILMDLSDHYWHMGLHGAAVLANRYKEAQIFVCHWGTVDAPTADTFNGDPGKLAEVIVNPERIIVKAPGDALVIK